MTHKHTPTPWYYEPCRSSLAHKWEKYDIAYRSPPEYDNDYGIDTGSRYTHIATLRRQPSKITSEANAEFIVRACNNHYELLEALERILNWADPYAFPDCEKNLKDVECAEQAIKKAKGEA